MTAHLNLALCPTSVDLTVVKPSIAKAMLGLILLFSHMHKKYRNRWIVCFNRDCERKIVRSFVLKYDARQAVLRYKQVEPQGSAYIVDSRNTKVMKTLGLM